jgi:hypothetical protein
LNNIRSNKDIIKIKWIGKAESPTEVTRRADPLHITIDEGSVKLGGRIEVKLLASEMVWLEATESVTQLVTAVRVKAIVLKELANDC